MGIDLISASTSLARCCCFCRCKTMVIATVACVRASVLRRKTLNVLHKEDGAW